MTTKDVLVIGASIVGIQVSIDLANMGFKVHLVESTPSIGGRMAQLDKTFPTNDCSICILAPKMIECFQHPNVDTMTYSEVASIEGNIGDFKVKVRKKPRYIDYNKCTGCGDCTTKCPTKVPNEFDLDLGQRKAIYLPFPQAVPRKVTIDAKVCKYLTKGVCRVCEKTCQAGAIKFDQKEEIVDLKVGAVVVATGLDFYDMKALPEYGYGKYKNIITSMEYERLQCASGPTLGHIKRPSDGKEPLRIAFIQCAGSRDVRHNLYCTGVCCMHTIKEAIMSNEHNNATESFVFYMDMRTPGKNFQEYMYRAEKEYKVNFIRSRPAKVTVNEKGDPIVWYEDTVDRKLKSMTVDLVILAQALVPSKGTKEMAKVLGVKQDQFGFLDIPDSLLKPVDTSVPGIFACGFCQAPTDIPEGVAQASGAAARVAEMLEVSSR